MVESLVTHPRMTWDLSHWLKPSSQVCGEKFFRFRKEMQPVCWTYQPVAFVSIDNVFHRFLRLPHGFDHLIAFGLHDPRVIRPLPDQQRRLDALDEKPGERAFRKSSSLSGSPTRRTNSALAGAPSREEGFSPTSAHY